MKKTTYALRGGMAIAGLSLAILTSCAKQYTCRCETNDGFVTTSEISEGSEEKSAAACEDLEYSSSYTVDSVTYTTVNTCELQ